MQCPFTTDLRSFELSLDQLDYNSVASGQTALDSALKESISVFARNDVSGNKLLLVFSDGEDFSPNLKGILSSLQKQEVSLFSVGVGTLQGAPVPIVDEMGREIGHEKDRSGKPILTKLGEPVLQQTSKVLNGGYVRASYSGSDEAEILNFIKKFEAEKFGEKSVAGKQEKYHIFAGLSGLALIAEWFL